MIRDHLRYKLTPKQKLNRFGLDPLIFQLHLSRVLGERWPLISCIAPTFHLRLSQPFCYFEWVFLRCLSIQLNCKHVDGNKSQFACQCSNNYYFFYRNCLDCPCKQVIYSSMEVWFGIFDVLFKWQANCQML